MELYAVLEFNRQLKLLLDHLYPSDTYIQGRSKGGGAGGPGPPQNKSKTC
jgi:hypothetical protein